MSRSKLRRFAELQTFINTFEPAKPGFIDWHKYFNNHNKIILELACGHGAYAINLAKMFPAQNFIGVDIKGARVWRGAKTALEEKLNNVAFLRTHIEWLDKYFMPNSVAEIWLTFPDPFSKKSQENNRLTSPKFLKLYNTILKSDGVINLKTDDFALFEYSVETAINKNFKIKEIINNIYAHQKIPAKLAIQTVYEKKHLKNNKQIHYLKIMK